MTAETRFDFSVICQQAASESPEDWDHAANSLVQFFGQIDHRPMAQFNQTDEAGFITVAQQAFQAFCTLLVNPLFRISDVLFFQLCVAKAGIEVILILNNIQAPLIVYQQLDALEIDRDQWLARKLLVLNAVIFAQTGATALRELLQEAPLFYRYYGLMGCCFSRMALLPGHRDFRAFIYRQRFDPDAVARLSPFNPMHFVAPWLATSYQLDQDVAAGFRAHLNEVIRAHFAHRGFSPRALPDEANKNSGRLKIAMIVEVFSRDSVLFRCYGHLMRELIQHHDVTLLAAASATEDPEICRLFRNQVLTLDEEDVAKSIRQVQSVQADVAFYPCIGMSWLSIGLANLRLCPIQVAAVGVPDSTQTQEIDYLIIDHHLSSGDEAALAHYSEKIISVKQPDGETFAFEPVSAYRDIEVNIQRNPRFMNVAVLANLAKLNGEMIGLCRRLKQTSDKPIIFHFFPNIAQFEQLALTQLLQIELEHAIAYPRTDTHTYLSLLNRCDLALGSFPFGGTNTILDAFACGIPVVSLVGKTPQEMTDAHIHGMVGTTDKLVTNDEAAYFDLALQLIQDNDRRCELAYFVQSRYQACFAPLEETHAFAQALSWLQTSHADLHTRDTKVHLFTANQTVSSA